MTNQNPVSLNIIYNDKSTGMLVITKKEYKKFKFKSLFSRRVFVQGVMIKIPEEKVSDNCEVLINYDVIISITVNTNIK